MKSLFIDTSSFFMTIAIIDKNSILYLYQDNVYKDMASKIMPIIRDGFNNVNFEIRDLDKIFVVNGPGSFTGIRVGVTVAKVLAWALRKSVVPISSLELLATTNVNTKYVQPMIDARRGYVYTGTYDSDLNVINIDKYMLLSDIDMIDKTSVSHDEIVGAIKPKLDILKIVTKYSNNAGVNPHLLNPNYLKMTQAEERLQQQIND